MNTKEAKEIAKEFPKIELWWDRHIKLWTITPAKGYDGPADYIPSGWFPDMTDDELRANFAYNSDNYEAWSSKATAYR